ncbi:glycosyltransferase family 39 protein [Candidatus Sumerlaeota bacterium]|nr:glycosyltransferase family 39 protein [Candidatus Sumerlaeota bacterium]
MNRRKRKSRKKRKQDFVSETKHTFLKQSNIQCHDIREWTKTDTIIIAVLVLVGFSLRIYGASALGLWMDELQTYANARKISSLKFFHRPHFLSFIFARLALALGEQEICLRLPSFLSGLFSIPLIYFFCWRFINRETALATAILITISPYHIRFSQEARYYTEMLCFSLLTVYFMALFLCRRNVFYFFVSLLFGIANIGIHPTTYVFLLTVIFFVVVYLLTHVDFHRVLLSLKNNQFFLIIVAVLISTVLLFIALIISTTDLKSLSFSGVNIGNTISSIFYRISHFPNIEMTKGVSLTPKFFLRIFTHFPDYYGGGRHFIGALFGLFFILGMFYCLKNKYAWLVSWFWTAYVITVISLILFKGTMPFSEKYVIYLFPFYFLMVGAGFAFIYNALNLHRRYKILVTIVLILAINVPLIPAIVKVMTIEVCPYKSALKYIMKRSPGKEFKVIANSAVLSGFNFYRQRFGISPDNFVLYDKRRIFYNDKNLWFATMFYAGTSRQEIKLYETILSKYYRLEKIVPAFPNEKLWSIRLYRPNYQQIIYPFRPFRLNINQPDEAQSGELKINLTNLLGGDYVLRVTFPKMINPEELEFFLNNMRVSPTTHFTNTLEFNLLLKEGLNVFSIKARREKILSQCIPLSLDVEKGKSTFALKGYFFDYIKGIELPEIQFRQGELCLCFRCNGTAGYELKNLPEGKYLFSLRAINDVPASPLVEVKINKSIVGYFAFDKNNNEWDTKSFIYNNPASGDKKLEISFLNDLFAGEGEEKGRKLYLGAITLKRVKSTEKFGSSADNLINILRCTPPLNNLNYGFESTDYPGQLSGFWRFISKDVKYSFINRDGYRVLKFSIPAQSVGFQLNSKPLPVKDMNSIYFSVWAKSINMPNHSVNVMLHLYDKDRRLIHRQWLNVVGLTRSTDWTQLRSLRFIPRKAYFFVISINLYRNGERPGRNTESLFLRSPSFSPFQEKRK